jgi:hypothetical protein
MPIERILRAALPFMAGGAVAIFVAELTRAPGSSAGTSFPEAWFDEANRAPEHLWLGEPTFNWGD